MSRTGKHYQCYKYSIKSLYVVVVFVMSDHPTCVENKTLIITGNQLQPIFKEFICHMLSYTHITCSAMCHSLDCAKMGLNNSLNNKSMLV